jgi:Protein of unknown function (DUF3522)
MWEDVFTILSNLAFIIPIAIAYQYDKLVTCLVFTFQMVASAAYHTCNSFSWGCFGLPPLLLRNLDFFWAQFIVFMTAFNLILFPTYNKAWQWTPPLLVAAAATTVFLLQRWIGESMMLQFGIVAFAFGGLLLYWIIYAIYMWLKDRDGPLLPPYRWKYLTYGLALSGMSSSLYVTATQTHNLYWAIHSLWHIAAALGQTFLLMSWSKSLVNAKARPSTWILSVINSPGDAAAATATSTKKAASATRRFIHQAPPSRV